MLTFSVPQQRCLLYVAKKALVRDSFGCNDVPEAQRHKCILFLGEQRGTQLIMNLVLTEVESVSKYFPHMYKSSFGSQVQNKRYV